MKIETIISNGQELKGYVIKEKDYERFVKVEKNGKSYYILPFKFKRTKNPLEIEVVKRLILENKTKNEICQELNCEITRLNNLLQKHFISVRLPSIIEKLKKD